MKKTLLLLLVCVLATMLLASCSLLGGNPGDNQLTGYYTDGTDGLFITPDGAVLVSGGSAKSVSYTLESDTYKLGEKSFAKNSLTAAVFNAPVSAEEYFVIENGTITALSELGKTKAVLFIPESVKSVAEGAFAGGVLKSLVIGKNTASLNLSNGAFKGTTSLKVYIDGAASPDKITCSKDLLKDTTGVSFFVGQSAYLSFKEHYNWSSFASSTNKF